ncbi:hypothetical protein M9H77_18245 [Catharanthus roseus]|uniref:Uncharacterized protein n=1 Tax=Catharanthus roseus TaxID=4058 RepID=A0ACC0B740_CATRO|nr:hypothetical protein M9H77_18245 [Catharanthus roseus]
MPGGPSWQHPNLFLCLPQFLIPLLLSVSVNSSVATTQNWLFGFTLLRPFWSPNISVPLFYTEASRPVFWIEEESVVRFSNTSSDFKDPFLRVVIRFHHLFCGGFVYVTELITSVLSPTVVSEPEGDLIFLVSGVCYIPPSMQTSFETSQTRPFKV